MQEFTKRAASTTGKLKGNPAQRLGEDADGTCRARSLPCSESKEHGSGVSRIQGWAPRGANAMDVRAVVLGLGQFRHFGCLCALAEEDEDEEDEDGRPKPKKIRFSEGHRVAYLVANIDAEVSTVPRGAYVATAAHYIVRNAAYEGTAVVRVSAVVTSSLVCVPIVAMSVLACLTRVCGVVGSDTGL